MSRVGGAGDDADEDRLTEGATGGSVGALDGAAAAGSAATVSDERDADVAPAEPPAPSVGPD